MIKVESVARSEILSIMEWDSESDLARGMHELTARPGAIAARVMLYCQIKKIRL